MKRLTRVLGIGAATVVLALGGVAVLGANDGWYGSAASAESVLPADVQDAVLDALVGPEGEYAAYATYEAILAEYGQVSPFANILKAEGSHIDALKQILDRYGVPYPDENPYLGVVEAPGSLAEAAQEGVDAEIANVGLYEEQLTVAADYPDIVAVFTNLQTASLERHLPAFERALARF